MLGNLSLNGNSKLQVILLTVFMTSSCTSSQLTGSSPTQPGQKNDPAPATNHPTQPNQPSQAVGSSAPGVNSVGSQPQSGPAVPGAFYPATAQTGIAPSSNNTNSTSDRTNEVNIPTAVTPAQPVPNAVTPGDTGSTQPNNGVTTIPDSPGGVTPFNQPPVGITPTNPSGPPGVTPMLPPPGVTPTNPPPGVVPPIVPPITPPISNPPVDPPVSPPTTSPTMKFGIHCIVGAGIASHALEPGYVAQISSPAGQVLAAGRMTYAGMINAVVEPIPNPQVAGGSTKTLKMQLPLTYVSPQLVPGEQIGHLNICRATDRSSPPELAQCESEDSIRAEAASKDIDALTNERFMVTNMEVKYNYQNNLVNIEEYHPTPAQANPQDNLYSIVLRTHHPVFESISRDYCEPALGSPLVLELEKNKLVAFSEKPVFFDLNALGHAGLIGWIQKQNGFLALDVNGNGKIDDGSELFGNASSHADGKKFQFENGFEALRQYDSNHDGMIDSKDPIFDKLVVWVDANSNGISEKGELKPLRDYGITGIELNYGQDAQLAKLDAFGNQVRLVGKYHLKNGETRAIYDVWFKFFEKQKR